MAGVRVLVVLLSALGTLAFGGAFALSLADPLLVERAARELVRIEVEREIGKRIDALSDFRIAALAQQALARTGLDIRRMQDALRSEVPKRTADVVSNMLDPQCECRKRLAGYVANTRQLRLGSLFEARERLGELIESSYASVSQNLLREFRIFTATNALAFALLGGITLLRRHASAQLVLPAVVLVGAVTITSSLYLFNQDWLHTIVFGQYVGFAYCGYLAVVAALLADIAFNRARVSTRIANGLLQAVGAAASVLPC